MSCRDQLPSPTEVKARERLLDVAGHCRVTGRERLARLIESGALDGIRDPHATVLAGARYLMPVEAVPWCETDWVVAAFDDDQQFIGAWSFIPTKGAHR